uniref:Uncharacterized protein n=1 Tax=Steinernema glaseri TaxID=37863 RepID=A0A1I8ARI8_9BILA
MKTSLLVLLVAIVLVAAAELKLENVLGADKDVYGPDGGYMEAFEKLPAKRSMCPSGYRPQIYFGQLICY